MLSTPLRTSTYVEQAYHIGRTDWPIRRKGLRCRWIVQRIGNPSSIRRLQNRLTTRATTILLRMYGCLTTVPPFAASRLKQAALRGVGLAGARSLLAESDERDCDTIQEKY